MHFRHLFFILLLLLLPFLSGAQQIHAHKNTVKDGYNFWVYTPVDYDSGGAEKPVLLFLHGASLRGSNMDLVLRYGPIDALRRGCHIDAVIISPQCPRGSRWDPERVIRVVDWVEQHYAVDTNRLYVFGMSLGGYGTLDFVGTYPDRVAAAIAMCGGSRQQNYCELNKLPLWIIHGTADRAVTLEQSQKVVNAMKACGPTDRLLFTKLQGQNHGALARIFYLSEPYEWLFAHSLTDTDRAANHDHEIQVSDMKRAYKDLTRQNITVGNSLAMQSARFSNGSQRNDTEVAAKLTDKMCHGIKELSEDGDVEAPYNANLQSGNATDSKENSSATRQQRASAKTYHTIKQDDTLCTIARRYHTSVKALCRLNNIKETTTLRIGRLLRVK